MRISWMWIQDRAQIFTFFLETLKATDNVLHLVISLNVSNGFIFYIIYLFFKF